MSIVLKDGTVLPDIPSEYAGKYPFATIFHGQAAAGTDEGMYVLRMCSNEAFYVPAEVSGTGEEFIYVSTDGLYGGMCLAGESSWAGFEQTDTKEIENQINSVDADGFITTLVWSNHDILSVADGSIFYPPAESPPFILPDGTELPALPEGCFEKYPYGMISYVESTDGEAAYALSVAEGTYIFAPGSATGEGSDYVISLLPGYRHYRYVVAPTAASGWEQYAESTTQHSGHDFSREDGTIEIRWCNHDILTATAMNDDGTPEIGPDLYRKSDVNYRIYGGWLNSMGNQARRLGGVSGALKPGEMETVFKGVTAGGGDIVEPETYPSASGVTFGNVYSTEPVPTGKYIYGSCPVALPPLPSTQHAYQAVYYRSDDNKYRFLAMNCPMLYYYAGYNMKGFIGSVEPNKCEFWEILGNNVADATGWTHCETRENNTSYFSFEGGKGHWVNHNVFAQYDGDGYAKGDLYLPISVPIQEVQDGIVTTPVDREYTYTIDGDTLNAIAGHIQKISGTSALLTPSGMVAALNTLGGGS